MRKIKIRTCPFLLTQLTINFCPIRSFWDLIEVRFLELSCFRWIISVISFQNLWFTEIRHSERTVRPSGTAACRHQPHWPRRSLIPHKQLASAVTEHSQHHTWHNIFRFPYQGILCEDEHQERTELELIVIFYSPPSSPLFALPQLPLPLCISSLPASSLPRHAALLTESVSLWLSHPARPLKLPLALHLFLFAGSSIYSSVDLQCVGSLFVFFFFVCLVLSCGVS